MTNKLTTDGVNVILGAIEADYDDNNYYVFTSKYTPWANGDVAPATANASVLFSQQVRNELMVLKKILPSGVKRMCRRINWNPQVVYDEYDDEVDLSGLNYYVVTQSRNVYKCLDNGDGNPSTVPPNMTTNATFQTADGYKWKYMFSISEDAMSVHATSNTIPVETSIPVSESAVSGAIDRIRVTGSANGWPSQESTTVVEALANNFFRVNRFDHMEANFYSDSSLYVTGGGGAGFVAKISQSAANASGYYITTTTGNNLVTVGSTVLISPYVDIGGNGAGAKAYATVNNSSGVINKVVIVNPGSGYTWANASITCNALHQSVATLKAVTGPKGGHGYDPYTELGADTVKFSVRVDPDEGLAVPYRVTGIMKNPQNYDQTDVTTNIALAYNQAFISLLPGITTPPSAGEVITGLTSGATATIISANTSSIYFADVTGTFVQDENILGATSSSVATLTAINNSDVNTDTGQIMFVNQMTAIQRQINSSEIVYVELKL